MRRTMSFAMSAVGVAAILVVGTRSAVSAGGQAPALVRLQVATPGTVQNGNVNIGGRIISKTMRTSSGDAGNPITRSTNTAAGDGILGISQAAGTFTFTDLAAVRGSTNGASTAGVLGISDDYSGVIGYARGTGTGVFGRTDGSGPAARFWATGTGNALETLGTSVFGGAVGIGTGATSVPLTFNSVLGNKISLWGGDAAGHYGFGVQSGTLQIYSDAAGAMTAIGTGSSGSFSENIRFQGNGQVSLNGGPPNGNNELFINSRDGVTFEELDGTNNTGFQLTNGTGTGYIYAPGGTSHLSLLSFDAVGIGTAAPATTLDVRGTGSYSGNVAGPGNVLSSENTGTGDGVFAISGSAATSYPFSDRGAVFGSTSSAGRTGVIGVSTNWIGMFGYSTTAGGYGVIGNKGGSGGDAIRSVGNLTVLGTLAKSGGAFKIDHPLDPENKFLWHSFVESPDMMNIYNGNVRTDERGYATITMPDYFEALNRDFRYQLTVLDEGDTEDFVMAKVVRKMANGRFMIRSSKPGAEISWMVTGIRHDPYAEAHRIPTVTEKGPAEKGKYMSADSYGRPWSQQITTENEFSHIPPKLTAPATKKKEVFRDPTH